MAEILGAVASGLSIAKAAGEILSTGLKLKLLLQEIRDAPENLQFLLGQVEVLAAALCDLNLDEVPEAGISATLCGSLRAATFQCRNSAEHLSCTISELSGQLETHRGFRRKVVAAKLVFKKGSLAKLEHRLYTTVQCLTSIQQLYIMPMSRTLKVGIPFLIGQITIQIRWEDEGEGYLQISRLPNTEKTTSVFKTTALGLKVQVPTWLAPRMIAFLIKKSYGAWQASLAVFRIHLLHEPQARKAMAIILSDNEHAMLQAFERRQIGPRDRFLDLNGNECTLSELALRFGAWRICNYLLDSSRDIVEKPLLWVMWHRRAQDEADLHQLQTLLKKDNFGDHARFQLFSNFQGDILSFDSTRRQIWPDDQFYSDSFRNHRIQFIWLLALSANALAPTFFRHILSPGGILRVQDIYTGRLQLGYWDDTLLHALALGVGSAAWHDRETSRQWALVAADMLPFVRNYHELAPFIRWDRFRTPLFTSLFVSLLPWPSTKIQDRGYITSLTKRFHYMESGMKAWLQVLKDAGIDLRAYGERETELFHLEVYERSFPIYSVADGDEVYWDDFLRCDVVLIGFQYGQEVDDWRLWWSEHTDAYAGDFWGRIESSIESIYQRVPGAWKEDKDSAIDETPETNDQSCSGGTSTDICAFKQ
ncbi:hypothetical protein G7054_g6188 [Neopestalotiopsis clavispora]|nr:hypothetical protein G7054_g6188 [Neopestalotiopsis clavispora]